MTHTRKNRGVCSKNTTVTLEGDIVQEVQVAGGCDGNLQGVCTLLRGRRAHEAVSLLKDILCESGMATSCPAQIALCIEEALALQEAGKAPSQAG